MYVMFLKPNYGPGPLLVSSHDGGWASHLNFPYTTNQFRFAKRWEEWHGKGSALEWAQKHGLKPDAYEIFYNPEETPAN